MELEELGFWTCVQVVYIDGVALRYPKENGLNAAHVLPRPFVTTQEARRCQTVPPLLHDTKKEIGEKESDTCFTVLALHVGYEYTRGP